MRKDPTAFRERFKRWKETGEYKLPEFKDGKEKINYKRWDDAELTSYSVPFIKDKRITLTNAGRATGAVLSTNLLDSLADNAVRGGLDPKTMIGISTKETTLGNPTDTKSAFNLSSGIRRLFNGKYPGTEQHINYWGDALNEREDVINYHKGHQTDDPKSGGKSVLQEAAEFFSKHPDSYNPGQPGYAKFVKKVSDEVWLSPEIKRWYNAWTTKNKLKNSRWNRVNPLLKESKFNLPKFAMGTEGDDIEELIRKRLEQRSDNTSVKKEPIYLPIKREYGKVVDPKLVERKQLQQPTITRGSTYKVKPRPQTFAGRIAQVTGNDWIKTDATSAGIGIGLSLIPVIGPVLSAAWGAPDFGYDLNESVHNLTDQESHANTVMSGMALLPYVNRFNLLKGKSYIDRLRNAYNSLMTKYNTSREVNKALKTAKLSDSVLDGTSGIFDEYAKQWFNNEVSFIRPYRSSGGKGNTVGDVIDYNLGIFGGRDKPLSELTDNQRYRIAKILSKDEQFPRGTRVIHMDDSGPQPVNNVGFVPKDASNSNSVWNSSLRGLPEIWWNRGVPYYNAKGYRSIQDIPRTIISDVEDLKRSGITLEGMNVLHGPGVVPFQSIQYGIQPNPFGWFDRIKFVGQ